MGVKAPLRNPPPTKRPGEKNQPGSRIRARITNLSYDGCEIDGIALDVGDSVKLELAGLGKVEAEMRWIDGNKGGARFVDQ